MTGYTELIYQPIGQRWAENLGRFKAAEPVRFVRQYRSMSASSSVVLASTAATWKPPPLPASAPAGPEAAE